MKNIKYIFIVFAFISMANAQFFSDKSDISGVSIVINSNGAAVADYDLDGDLDIYFVSADYYNASNEKTWNRLMRNDGNGKFVDVASEAGVLSTLKLNKFGIMGEKFSGAWGDYNSDGYPDLYVTNLGANELYHNNGDGTFNNIALQAGVRGPGSQTTSSAFWWDYDLDGDLDIYVCSWTSANIAYKNNGDGTFSDVTESLGLGDENASLSAMPFDANNDNLVDLYVVNDYGWNKFYLNNGNGSFTELTEQFGLADSGNGMGVAIGDYNNDGFFDIFTTNISYLDDTPNALFKNTGLASFENHGVESGGWPGKLGLGL